jgi:hypothetical protein
LRADVAHGEGSHWLIDGIQFLVLSSDGLDGKFIDLWNVVLTFEVVCSVNINPHMLSSFS